MKVAIRADASAEIGTGHMVRCRTLARELRRRGAEIMFICRAHRGNMIDVLRDEGFCLHVLPEPRRPAGSPPLQGYETWLGTTQEDDVEQTARALGSFEADWIVCDHYALAAPWQHLLRREARRVMVIDDLADRPHDCDLLLDQNLVLDGAARYEGLVPDRCAMLLGPRFALLAPGYGVAREALASRNGAIRRVLVFMGGSDLSDATGLAVEAMCLPGLEQTQLDVVVGANYAFTDILAKRLAERGNATLQGPLPDLVATMVQADLAIGAGGTTSWERLCLGLPAVVVSLAENQVPGCQALARSELAVYAGPREGLTVSELGNVVQELISNPRRLREMSERAMAMVDGRGTNRVADRLTDRI